jgi:hypothetical protein
MIGETWATKFVGNAREDAGRLTRNLLRRRELLLRRCLCTPVVMSEREPRSGIVVPQESVKDECDLVDVAPAPVLAGLDERMIGCDVA